MWSRSGCPLLASGDENSYVRLNSGKYARSARHLRSTAARRVMQRDEDVPFLVPSRVCVCARVLCIARVENDFVDVIPRLHGHTMFGECLPVWPDSLLLHGAVFHSRCHCFARIWNWPATVWAGRVEMDW